MKSSDIRAAMSARWAAPEYAIMWEVGEGTGTRTGRWADAVIMGLWPSRGLLLEGVEIKTSRADWRREAKDPKKAEAIAKYCDRWWVHVTPGCVDDVSEVPPSWGLREWSGAKWRTLREATQNPSVEPINRTFLAALLRRGDETMRTMLRESLEKAREAEMQAARTAKESWAKDVERAAATRTADLDYLLVWKTKFEAIFGGDVVQRWGGADAAQLARICRAIDKSGLAGDWASVFHIAKDMRKGADMIDSAFADFKKPDEVK